MVKENVNVTETWLLAERRSQPSRYPGLEYHEQRTRVDQPFDTSEIHSFLMITVMALSALAMYPSKYKYS